MKILRKTHPKCLFGRMKKIVTTSARENTDPRAGRKQNQLYIQMTFIYSNYNDFLRFLVSSLGIKHDECIIRPAVLPQSILSAEVPASTLGKSPPLYNTVRLIHQRLHQQYLYLLQGSQPSALFLYKNENEADTIQPLPMYPLHSRCF